MPGTTVGGMRAGRTSGLKTASTRGARLPKPHQIGMRVAVENVFDEDPEALLMLIEKIANPDFGFCFDAGHFNLFSSVPMEQWFARLGRYLIEVHLHDNDGAEDSHWAIGRGKIDFEKFFSLLRKYAPMPVYTVEAHDKEDVQVSLERVKHFLNR